jgi:predicted nuclease of predicted toxin-antitoxin system
VKALADENFPLAAVRELRGLGWDIVTAEDWRPASDDLEVLTKARVEGRILLTFDKDFGELTLEAAPTAPHGVVLFRLPNLSAADLIRRVVDALTARTEGAGGFWVVEAERVRARRVGIGRWD